MAINPSQSADNLATELNTSPQDNVATAAAATGRLMLERSEAMFAAAGTDEKKVQEANKIALAGLTSLATAEKALEGHQTNVLLQDSADMSDVDFEVQLTADIGAGKISIDQAIAARESRKKMQQGNYKATEDAILTGNVNEADALTMAGNNENTKEMVGEQYDAFDQTDEIAHDVNALVDPNGVRWDELAENVLANIDPDSPARDILVNILLDKADAAKHMRTEAGFEQSKRAILAQKEEAMLLMDTIKYHWKLWGKYALIGFAIGTGAGLIGGAAIGGAVIGATGTGIGLGGALGGALLGAGASLTGGAIGIATGGLRGEILDIQAQMEGRKANAERMRGEIAQISAKTGINEALILKQFVEISGRYAAQGYTHVKPEQFLKMLYEKTGLSDIENSINALNSMNFNLGLKQT